MRKVIFILVLVILIPVGLFGQTIDPTVEVSREFDVKLGEIHKPEIPKNVADSLRSFNISFDYSIFNRPYRDLYEFSPHESAAIKPAKDARHPFSYLKIGAQFPLKPSAELYLQAVTKKGFMPAFTLTTTLIGERYHRRSASMRWMCARCATILGPI